MLIERPAGENVMSDGMIRKVQFFSQDFRPCEVYTIEFLIDNTTMGFLMSDSEKNLVLYMYQPESRESCGGQRLLRKADFHLGQSVNTFFRIKCKIGDSLEEQKHFSGADRRQITMFGEHHNYCSMNIYFFIIF